jgi:hypothetical protein
MAEEVDGKLEAAEGLAGGRRDRRGMPLAYSMAANNLASVLIDRGEGGGGVTSRSLAAGIPLIVVEARLVLAATALLRGEPGAEVTAAEALAQAEAYDMVSRPSTEGSRRCQGASFGPAGPPRSRSASGAPSCSPTSAIHQPHRGLGRRRRLGLPAQVAQRDPGSLFRSHGGEE